MIFVGIDPGAKGGYGILGGSEGSAIAYPYDRDDFLWHMRALAEKERARPGRVFLFRRRRFLKRFSTANSVR